MTEEKKEKSTLDLVRDELESRGKKKWADYLTYGLVLLMLVILLLILW